jgi:hypothetical protein
MLATPARRSAGGSRMRLGAWKSPISAQLLASTGIALE